MCDILPGSSGVVQRESDDARIAGVPSALTEKRMRIIYIDIDSCRPDHLGCYGYGRPTSPVIDELAQNAVRFTNCHTSDAPCLPSRAALFSGRFGINNGVTCHEGPASQMRYAGRGHWHDPARPMLMRYFQLKGWETVCFSGFGQRHLAWWFSAGFTQNFGNQLPGASETAAEVAGKAIDWLRVNGKSDNYFMHINFWDVHHPYKAPQAYFDRVSSKPGPAFPDAKAIASDVQNYYGPRTARDWWMGSPNWTNGRTGSTARMPASNPDTHENFMGFIDGHDAGIAYVDEKIGEILAELDRLGVRDDTAIIVSADHAESIGELGMYFEHGNCAEGTTHVPLIIHWPNKTRGRKVVDGLIYQLDLCPTILDMLGLEQPKHWDGQSFAGALRGEQFGGRENLILGCGIFSYQRAVRSPRYRLIRTIHAGLYPYEPLYLFDMQSDPNQTKNIAADNPAVVAELDHVMFEWLMRYTTGPAGVRDPFQEQLAAGITPDIYCPRELVEQNRQKQFVCIDHRALFCVL